MSSEAPLTILVPARDEEERIADAVTALRAAFPGTEVIVADDGSRDGTAARGEEAGAVVLRLPRLGKGEALSAAERAAPPGALLVCDADIHGSLRPLVDTEADLTAAVFASRAGGGFGIAKRIARDLVRLRSGFVAREPLSGQRYVGPRARVACFPLARGFGCEVRMTIDAVRAGLSVQELELELAHRPTGRDPAGFAHRGRQLLEAVLAAGPLATNHRGNRLPILGWACGLGSPAVAAIAAFGLADDLWSGPERGFHAHVRAARTTGVAKLVGIPAVSFAATRSLTGALLVSLAANFLNQLDTKPGRCLKAYLAASLALGTPKRLAVLLLAYDLRERMMLGDGGSNALGAVLGLDSVGRLRGRARWAAIAALVGVTAYGERRSLGTLIERTPVLAPLDRLGRVH